MIVGTHDFICPPGVAHEMHGGIPDAQLSEPRESGHFGHIEQPDEFAAIVSDFVNNQEMEKQA
ncbi:alpha/beta fold hydrolase [Streptomyces sp. NPDC001100]